MYRYGTDWRRDLDGDQQAEFWEFLFDDFSEGHESWGHVSFVLYAAS